MNTSTVLGALRRTVFLGAATVLTLALFSPVVAADRYVRSTNVAVSIRGLDLSRPADLRQFYRRIDREAGRVCRGNPANRSLVELQRLRDCRETAVVDTVRGVNNPQLTALIAARNTLSG